MILYARQQSGPVSFDEVYRQEMEAISERRKAVAASSGSSSNANISLPGGVYNSSHGSPTTGKIDFMEELPEEDEKPSEPCTVICEEDTVSIGGLKLDINTR